MFRIIIIYELTFLFFWNLLYYSNSGIENWFQEKFLAGVYTVLSTMALGFALLYVILITLRISGISDKLKKLKDPRKNQK